MRADVRCAHATLCDWCNWCWCNLAAHVLSARVRAADVCILAAHIRACAHGRSHGCAHGHAHVGWCWCILAALDLAALDLAAHILSAHILSASVHHAANARILAARILAARIRAHAHGLANCHGHG